MSLFLRYGTTRPGFALPTLLVVSVAMLIIMASAVSAVSTSRTALNGQYYNQLAREAAESGLARAKSCLQGSNYIATWGMGASGKPLRPNTSCAGGDACTSPASCFIISRPDLRTTFSVDAPTSTLAGVQTVTVKASVELLRSSGSSQPWKTYTESANARVGAQVGFDNVKFGYYSSGAYFYTQGTDGVVRGTGWNGFGQLGNGSYSSAQTPTAVKPLPGGATVANIFTSFVSRGMNTFMTASDGNIYGMGYGGQGQLGTGGTAYYPSPTRFLLPSPERGMSVTPLGDSTFVQTESGKIYAAGSCASGRLGYSYTISGCSDQSTPQRVALPTVTSNLNTQPTTNLVADGATAYVRMAGGMVYGWGSNFFNRLGPNSSDGVDSSVPIVLGSFGVGTNPKANEVATDGEAVFVRDSNGLVTTYGRSMYGSRGTKTVHLLAGGYCMDNKSSNKVDMQTYYCNTTAAQMYVPYSTGAISAVIGGTTLCLSVTAATAGTAVKLVSCTPTSTSLPTTQRFTLGSDGLIRIDANTNLCVLSTPTVSLTLAACNASQSGQVWSLYQTGDTGLPFDLPASAGTAVQLATDQWTLSVLTSNGQVWSAGLNDHGQLGIGTVRGPAVAIPTRFVLPAGVTAVDVTTTAVGAAGSNYSNTFVVGSDGKVYGAGSNYYGQLGNGNTTDQATPVAMTGIGGAGNPKAVRVQSGFGTTIILTDNQRIYTVGNNGSGQLGDGTTTNSSIPRINRYTNIIPSTIF